MDLETRQFTRYGAYAIVLKDHRLLLTQKKSGPYKGLWGLPGGAIEFGETPELTLKREIQEETAYAAESLELVTVMTNYGKYLNNEKAYYVHHIGIIYRVNGISLLSGIIPEEQKRWLAIQEIIPDELTPFAKQACSNKFFWR